MLRLVLAAALLQSSIGRLVYEPQADFYGADEIKVEVTTDADADNASTVVPIVVSPVDDEAGRPVVARRPAVPRQFHAVEATRFQE